MLQATHTPPRGLAAASHAHALQTLSKGYDLDTNPRGAILSLFSPTSSPADHHQPTVLGKSYGIAASAGVLLGSQTHPDTAAARFVLVQNPAKNRTTFVQSDDHKSGPMERNVKNSALREAMGISSPASRC
jgi:hypothetical protein